MVSKDLGFPVVALPGVGYTPAKGRDEQEAARVIYVAAKRATQSVVIGGWGWGFGVLLHDCTNTQRPEYQSKASLFNHS